MYYYRYLSLFVLEEFPDVIRDTARNIRQYRHLLNNMQKAGTGSADYRAIPPLRHHDERPHHGRTIPFKERGYNDALKAVDAGLTEIREFFASFGQEQAYGRSNEVRVLKRFAKEIRRKLPVDPWIGFAGSWQRPSRRKNMKKPHVCAIKSRRCVLPDQVAASAAE